MIQTFVASPIVWTLTVLAGTLIYATIRYITFGPFGFNDIPLFILNKSVSWSSVILILLSMWQKSEYRKHYFLHIRLLLVIHAGISLILIAPEVYPKFFQNRSISLSGGLAILAGILSFTAFFFKFFIPHPKPDEPVSLPTKFQISVTALVLFLLHTAFIGASGWFTPENWNGAMPPITLLAFLAGLIALILTLLRRKELV